MCRSEFSAEVVAQIVRDRFEHPHPRVQQKMEVLWLWSHGLTAVEVARLGAVSRRTAERYLREFIEGGLEVTRQVRWRGPTSQLAAHRSSLEQEFLERPACTVGEAGTRIERLTGVKRQATQVRKFLKRNLNLKWRRVKAVPLPPKLTLPEHVEKQAEFLEKHLQPALQAAFAGLLSLYFVDAAHMVQGSYLGSLWSVLVLYVRAASGRQRYNVLGAINPFAKSFVSVRNTGYVTATTVCELLHKLAAQSTGLPITLVLDNARYQKCALVQSLAEQLGITLLYLPSYSPNLNLIERLWKFVKKTSLNSRSHDTFAEFQAAIDKCLDELFTTHTDAVKTLLNPEFQTFEKASILAA
jgi:transposase